MDAFIHGFILAFGLILPLGAQNIFIFNQGANQPKFLKALPAIITAALADTLLISLAVLGVSVVIFNFIWIKTILLTIGFFFLIYMGWITWRSTNIQIEQTGQALSTKKQVFFATSVSLLNPHAILDTIGVIGTSSIQYLGNEKGFFALATILVSWGWFILLAALGRMVGRIDNTGKWVTRLNRISSIIIWGVAIYIGKTLLNIG